MRLLLKMSGLTFALLVAPILSITPRSDEQAQAQSMTPAQLAAFLQTGDHTGVQCYNQRAFCRADVSRCKGNQRERINWRKECRGKYERAFKNCVRTIPAFRPNTNARMPSDELARQQRAYQVRRCGHTRNGASRCEIEIAACPSFDSCEQQYGQCGTTHTEQALPSGQQEDYELEPVRPQSEPQRILRAVEADTRYRVFVKNSCRRAIDIAYFYEENEGQWAKTGWRGLQPGRTAELKSPIMTRRLGLHSSFGIAEARYRTASEKHVIVVDRNFLLPINEQVREKGARSERFQGLEWASDIVRPLIVIERCDEYKAGNRVRPASEPVPQLLPVVTPEQAAPSPTVSQERASQPLPAKPSLAGEVKCVDVSGVTGNELARLEDMERRGVLKLCASE